MGKIAVTEPLERNQKFRLRYALANIPRTHIMETSIRFR